MCLPKIPLLGLPVTIRSSWLQATVLNEVQLFLPSSLSCSTSAAQHREQTLWKCVSVFTSLWGAGGLPARSGAPGREAIFRVWDMPLFTLVPAPAHWDHQGRGRMSAGVLLYVTVYWQEAFL